MLLNVKKVEDKTNSSKNEFILWYFCIALYRIEVHLLTIKTIRDLSL